ncbi:hypothetical protein EIP86_002654 [Pleurotus ostreatoroseus]|nr:hypothetical protein EIP86_002654 [Pleurotus ostreatoroseus]
MDGRDSGARSASSAPFAHADSDQPPASAPPAPPNASSTSPSPSTSRHLAPQPASPPPPPHHQMSRNAVHNNSKLFPMFRSNLADAKSYASTVQKLLGWMGRDKAYYPDARPWTAKRTVAVHGGGRFCGTFEHVSQCTDSPFLRPYMDLVATLAKFRYLFPEPDLLARIDALTMTIVGRPSAGPSPAPPAPAGSLPALAPAPAARGLAIPIPIAPSPNPYPALASPVSPMTPAYPPGPPPRPQLSVSTAAPGFAAPAPLFAGAASSPLFRAAPVQVPFAGAPPPAPAPMRSPAAERPGSSSSASASAGGTRAEGRRAATPLSAQSQPKAGPSNLTQAPRPSSRTSLPSASASGSSTPAPTTSTSASAPLPHHKKEKKKKKNVAPLTFLEADLDWYIEQKKQGSPEAAHAQVGVGIVVKREGGDVRDEVGVGVRMAKVKTQGGGGSVDGRASGNVDGGGGDGAVLVASQDIVSPAPREAHDVEMLVSRTSHRGSLANVVFTPQETPHTATSEAEGSTEPVPGGTPAVAAPSQDARSATAEPQAQAPGSAAPSQPAQTAGPSSITTDDHDTQPNPDVPLPLPTSPNHPTDQSPSTPSNAADSQTHDSHPGASTDQAPALAPRARDSGTPTPLPPASASASATASGGPSLSLPSSLVSANTDADTDADADADAEMILNQLAQRDGAWSSAVRDAVAAARRSSSAAPADVPPVPQAAAAAAVAPSSPSLSSASTPIPTSTTTTTTHPHAHAPPQHSASPTLSARRTSAASSSPRLFSPTASPFDHLPRAERSPRRAVPVLRIQPVPASMRASAAASASAPSAGGVAAMTEGGKEKEATPVVGSPAAAKDGMLGLTGAVGHGQGQGQGQPSAMATPTPDSGASGQAGTQDPPAERSKATPPLGEPAAPNETHMRVTPDASSPRETEVDGAAGAGAGRKRKSGAHEGEDDVRGPVAKKRKSVAGVAVGVSTNADAEGGIAKAGETAALMDAADTVASDNSKDSEAGAQAQAIAPVEASVNVAEPQPKPTSPEPSAPPTTAEENHIPDKSQTADEADPEKPVEDAADTQGDQDMDLGSDDSVGQASEDVDMEATGASVLEPAAAVELASAMAEDVNMQTEPTPSEPVPQDGPAQEAQMQVESSAVSQPADGTQDDGTVKSRDYTLQAFADGDFVYPHRPDPETSNKTAQSPAAPAAADTQQQPPTSSPPTADRDDTPLSSHPLVSAVKQADVTFATSTVVPPAPTALETEIPLTWEVKVALARGVPVAHPPPPPDYDAVHFGASTQILGSGRGGSSWREALAWEFEVSAELKEELERWVYRYKTIESVEKPDVLSLRPNVWDWNMHPWVELNNGAETQKIAIVNYAVTEDHLLDLSARVRAGKNTLKMNYPYGNPRDWVYVLRLHSPTAPQLAELEGRRNSERRWRKALNDLANFRRPVLRWPVDIVPVRPRGRERAAAERLEGENRPE